MELREAIGVIEKAVDDYDRRIASASVTAPMSALDGMEARVMKVVRAWETVKEAITD